MPFKDPEIARAKNREYSKRWREAHPERRREAARRWWAANPEKKREYNERHRSPEKKRERYATDPEYRERVLAKNRAYRARQMGLGPGDWVSLWEAQGGICYLCEKPMDPERTVLDHDHRCCGGEKACRACWRGLTHIGCNVLIGKVGDDPAELEKIARNLRAAQSRVAV
jgi:hypothetical protein